MMAGSYEQLKAKLRKQRDMLKAALARIDSIPESGMGYTNHQADDASDAFEQAADLALRTNEQDLLYQVERALYRMEQGTYGICQKCGEMIDLARLTAIPHTRYCVACASQQEV
jgi:RNA polymerase-binding protein DksA